MIVLEMIALIIGLTVAVVLVTQIFIPLFQGTPFFPQLRKKSFVTVELEAAERELEEKRELSRVTEEIEKINRRQAEMENK